jgi:hypothetical protein
MIYQVTSRSQCIKQLRTSNCSPQFILWLEAYKYYVLMELHACFINPEFLIDCVGVLWILAGVVRYLGNIRTQSSVE